MELIERVIEATVAATEAEPNPVCFCSHCYELRARAAIRAVLEHYSVPGNIPDASAQEAMRAFMRQRQSDGLDVADSLDTWTCAAIAAAMRSELDLIK